MSIRSNENSPKNKKVKINTGFHFFIFRAILNQKPQPKDEYENKSMRDEISRKHTGRCVFDA